jgi:hypothetical protein
LVADAEPVAALTAADALLTASVPSGVAHPSAPLTSVTTDAQLLDAASMRFHRTHSTCPPAEAYIVTSFVPAAGITSTRHFQDGGAPRALWTRTVRETMAIMIADSFMPKRFIRNLRARL